jgi:hypothetical protein
MKKFSEKYSGYYRRYSDDILFICHPKHQNKAEKFIKRALIKSGKTLKISDTKTLISLFKSSQGNISCNSLQFKDGFPQPIKKPFEYLGLSFDGIQTSVRLSTLSKFYGKLSARIKKEVKIAYEKAKRKENKKLEISDFYKIISFDMIRNSYMKNKKQCPEQEFLGNFYTYIELACRVTNNQKIKNIFNGLNVWIKKRAKKYCSDLIT